MLTQFFCQINIYCNAKPVKYCNNRYDIYGINPNINIEESVTINHVIDELAKTPKIKIYEKV